MSPLLFHHRVPLPAWALGRVGWRLGGRDKQRGLTGPLWGLLSHGGGGDVGHVSIRFISAGDKHRHKPDSIPPLLKIFKLSTPSLLG